MGRKWSEMLFTLVMTARRRVRRRSEVSVTGLGVMVRCEGKGMDTMEKGFLASRFDTSH